MDKRFHQTDHRKGNTNSLLTYEKIFYLTRKTGNANSNFTEILFLHGQIYKDEKLNDVVCWYILVHY